MTSQINNKPYNVFSYLKRLKKYRFLFITLSRRELKIKYTRTILGVGWVFLQPLASVIIYTLFFHNFIKLNTNQIPYIQFVFSGIVCWYTFTGILSKVIHSLIESGELINKVSFPRVILVGAKAVPVLIESSVLYLILLGIVIFNNPVGIMGIIYSLFYLVQITLFSLGLGIIFSIIAVRIRDILHIVPFAIGFGIWLTPVFYPVSIVPQEYQHYILYLNPVANSIEGLRGCLFEGKSIGFDSLIVFVLSAFLVLTSLIFFIKFERKIIEKI